MSDRALFSGRVLRSLSSECDKEEQVDRDGGDMHAAWRAGRREGDGECMFECGRHWFIHHQFFIIMIYLA